MHGDNYSNLSNGGKSLRLDAYCSAKVVLSVNEYRTANPVRYLPLVKLASWVNTARVMIAFLHALSLVTLFYDMHRVIIDFMRPWFSVCCYDEIFAPWFLGSRS